METYTTKGAAARKARSLAKLAGVELKAVVFTRPALIKALGYTPTPKKRGTKNDINLGTAWPVEKVIWLKLPVTVRTIAHEVNHLRTTTRHNTTIFNNQVTALVRGMDPSKTRVKTYHVTVTTTRVVEKDEYTAQAAKVHYHSGKIISQTSKITAHEIKTKENGNVRK